MHKLACSSNRVARNILGVLLVAGTVCIAGPASAADTTRPVVSITSAAVSGTTLNVSVAATDNVGVTRVDLVIDGQYVANRTAAPWTFSTSISALGAGSHTVEAWAYDAVLNIGLSGKVGFTKGLNPSAADTTRPVVSITSAAVSGTTLNVSVAATDNVGVTRVDLVIDGQYVAKRTAAPWTFSASIGALGAGSHTVEAWAYDAKLNIGLSGKVGFAKNSSPTLAKWRLLNPGIVPDGQYSAQGELGAAFDPVRNRIFTVDWQGGAWVYDFVGAAVAVIKPLNGEQQIRGQSRNCSFAYLPTVDAVVTNLCGSSSNPPDGFAVFRFPNANTVVTTHQCLVDCGGPYTANFIAWNASLGAVVGGGGWAGSTDDIQRYTLPGGQFPAHETPWTLLPQSGPAPPDPPASCDICKEALRRAVLRKDKYVYVDPLTHNLFTYDFATATWAVTATTKPGPLPVNGVVGYDRVRDILVVWVGSDALYGHGPMRQQTWIYSFATNKWSLGPNGAAGDTTPGAANAVLSYMVWDTNLNRLILITTDEIASGFTRLWTLDWF